MGTNLTPGHGDRFEPWVKIGVIGSGTLSLLRLLAAVAYGLWKPRTPTS